MLNIHVSFVLLILIIKMNELQFVQLQMQKNVQSMDMMSFIKNSINGGDNIGMQKLFLL